MIIVDTSYCVVKPVSYKTKMFNAAHKEAQFSLKRFPFLTYRQAFSNALRGFHAVANGFTGVL